VFIEDRLEGRAVELAGRVAPVPEDTQHAFDGVAATYDSSNARNPGLVAMRRRALAALSAALPEGGRVLDLGCGPGTDEPDLAALGYRITAIDWSPAMVEEARRRVVSAGLSDRVEVRRLGIDEVDALEPGAFDGAWSNFGPLNCVADLPPAARAIARCLRPGGILVASVIGRVCPWEIGLYLARGEWRRARLRFSRSFVAVPLQGRRIWTRYYSPSEFERAFAEAGFARQSLRALALLAPPPYLEGWAARHPGVFQALWRVEDSVAHLPGVRAWGDHFLVVMRKREAQP
jgi:SAM-dependent methyltransferase